MNVNSAPPTRCMISQFNAARLSWLWLDTSGPMTLAVAAPAPVAVTAAPRAATATVRRRASRGRLTKGTRARINEVQTEIWRCRNLSPCLSSSSFLGSNLGMGWPRTESPSVFESRNTDQEFNRRNNLRSGVQREEQSVLAELQSCGCSPFVHAFWRNSDEHRQSRDGKGSLRRTGAPLTERAADRPLHRAYLRLDSSPTRHRGAC